MSCESKGRACSQLISAIAKTCNINPRLGFGTPQISGTNERQRGRLTLSQGMLEYTFEEFLNNGKHINKSQGISRYLSEGKLRNRGGTTEQEVTKNSVPRAEERIQ